MSRRVCLLSRGRSILDGAPTLQDLLRSEMNTVWTMASKQPLLFPCVIEEMDVLCNYYNISQVEFDSLGLVLSIVPILYI